MTKKQSGPRTLVFGGGGIHDYRSVCPVLAEVAKATLGGRVEVVEEDYDAFLPERLAGVDLVVLYHTGSTLSRAQAQGLTGAVAQGMGLVGVHGAADSFRNSPEFRAMLGGEYKGHPFYREFTVSLYDPTPGVGSGPKHAMLRGLEGQTVERWEGGPVFEYRVRDEQFLLDCDPGNTVLATGLYKGIAWPVAWVREWGLGRVCYLALGHDVAACGEPFFGRMFAGGVEWAVRDVVSR